MVQSLQSGHGDPWAVVLKPWWWNDVHSPQTIGCEENTCFSSGLGEIKYTHTLMQVLFFFFLQLTLFDHQANPWKDKRLTESSVVVTAQAPPCPEWQKGGGAFLLLVNMCTCVWWQPNVTGGSSGQGGVLGPACGDSGGWWWPGHGLLPHCCWFQTLYHWAALSAPRLFRGWGFHQMAFRMVSNILDIQLKKSINIHFGNEKCTDPSGCQ